MEMPTHSGPQTLRRYPELDGATFLVGVGGTKCATSWTYWYLHSLPEVRCSAIKEMGFFSARFPEAELMSRDRLALDHVLEHLTLDGDKVENLHSRPHFRASLDRVQMIYDDNAYFEHFIRIRKPATRTYCDITPAYGALGNAGFEYMRRFFAPQRVTLKLFFTMRDPVQRLWSHLRMMQARDPSIDPVRDWRTLVADPGVVRRTDYAATVRALDRTFPGDQLLYLFYETLFTEAATRELSHFAGAQHRPARFESRHNETAVTTPLPAEVRKALREFLDPQYAFCRERFGSALPSAWMP